jgi:hypothetical protein
MSTDKLDYEVLMTRRLDDALSDEEALALDRELLRNPALRETFEVYARNDALTTEVLRREFDSGCGRVDIAAITQPPTVRRFARPHRGWLLIPGAIAAALLAMVVPMPRFLHTERPAVVNHTLSPAPFEHGIRPVSAQDGLYRNVNTTKRNTGRDVIGVIGEDGNIYWIEVDRTRTVTLPPRISGTTAPGL